LMVSGLSDEFQIPDTRYRIPDFRFLSGILNQVSGIFLIK